MAKWRQPQGQPMVMQRPRARITPELGGPRPTTALLGDMLLERNALTAQQLAEALEAQQTTGRRLGAVLVERGVIDTRMLTHLLSTQLGLPTVDLRRESPDDEAVAAVDESIARLHRVMPLRLTDGILDLAIADPLDETLADALSQLPVTDVRVYLAPEDDVLTAINGSYRALSNLDVQVREAYAAQAPLQSPPEINLTDADAPIIQLVNKIVTQALRDRTSDVHIEPTDGRLRVRFRIDGALNEVLSLPASLGPALVSRIKIMADMNIVERRRPQDGQFHMVIDGRELDVRVATTATIWGEKAVLRLLDKSRSLMRLNDLGMPMETYQVYNSIVHKPYGMVICSGPTGSGKTTTLYATLMEIARDELNVMTIEDPVEYVFPQINQMQINLQAEVTFASGLKSILRQDPDVILVGEIRDAETARIAVQSALTGHMVMSSLHATDAASALYRLLDMGIEPFLVSSSLVGVVGQRLVRQICPTCIASYTPSNNEIAWFEFLGGQEKKEFVRGTGCNYCSGTGYRDRVGVYEVLEVTDEIRALMVSGGTPHDVRELAIKQGMSTMGREAARLVAQDRTTIEEVIRHVYVS